MLPFFLFKKFFKFLLEYSFLLLFLFVYRGAIELKSRDSEKIISIPTLTLRQLKLREGM